MHVNNQHWHFNMHFERCFVTFPRICLSIIQFIVINQMIIKQKCLHNIKMCMLNFIFYFMTCIFQINDLMVTSLYCFGAKIVQVFWISYFFYHDIKNLWMNLEINLQINLWLKFQMVVMRIWVNCPERKNDGKTYRIFGIWQGDIKVCITQGKN